MRYKITFLITNDEEKWYYIVPAKSAKEALIVFVNDMIALGDIRLEKIVKVRKDK